MRLDEVRGFVFDVDGTLVQRAATEVRLIPGARKVLERIRASGRPYVLFTNGSHVAPEAIAAELRGAGLPVGDEQLLTPLRSVQMYLARFAEGPRVLPFLTDAAHRYLEAAGVRLVDGRNGARVDAVGEPICERTREKLRRNLFAADLEQLYAPAGVAYDRDLLGRVVELFGRRLALQQR